jgi:hypothetical protein
MNPKDIVTDLMTEAKLQYPTCIVEISLTCGSVIRPARILVMDKTRPHIVRVGLMAIHLHGTAIIHRHNKHPQKSAARSETKSGCSYLHSAEV